jgi:hypothetical protein
VCDVSEDGVCSANGDRLQSIDLKDEDRQTLLEQIEKLGGEGGQGRIEEWQNFMSWAKQMTEKQLGLAKSDVAIQPCARKTDCDVHTEQGTGGVQKAVEENDEARAVAAMDLEHQPTSAPETAEGTGDQCAAITDLSTKQHISAIGATTEISGETVVMTEFVEEQAHIMPKRAPQISDAACAGSTIPDEAVLQATDQVAIKPIFVPKRPREDVLYDFIVDGANVGYYAQHTLALAHEAVDHAQLDAVLVQLKQKGHRPMLVLHR